MEKGDQFFSKRAARRKKTAISRKSGNMRRGTKRAKVHGDFLRLKESEVGAKRE